MDDLKGPHYGWFTVPTFTYNYLLNIFSYIYIWFHWDSSILKAALRLAEPPGGPRCVYLPSQAICLGVNAGCYWQAVPGSVGFGGLWFGALVGFFFGWSNWRFGEYRGLHPVIRVYSNSWMVCIFWSFKKSSRNGGTLNFGNLHVEMAMKGPSSPSPFGSFAVAESEKKTSMVSMDWRLRSWMGNCS